MIKKTLKYAAIALIWLLIWQVGAMIAGEELLLPSPLSVIVRLAELCLTADFYITIATSLSRILLGMAAGIAIGALGGILTALVPLARDFVSPLLAVVKSTPVASFIVLFVLWISRDATPLIIASMMVIPVVWTNVETGILDTDKSLLEMARVYKMSATKKIGQIYLPSLSPYFFAALRSSLGMSWKAGIAAEVLLLPLISIGKMISDSKQALETVDLFAWTVVVVILSIIIEKLMVALLRKATEKHLNISKGGVRPG